MPIARPCFAAGDWAAVEQHLGRTLPADYKKLVDDGGGLVFDGELHIASPFEPVEHTNLVSLHAGAAWAAASSRARNPNGAAR